MLKSVIKTTLAILAMASLIVVPVIIAAQPTRHPEVRTIYAEVTEADNGLITVCDDDGNLWQYYTEENTYKNDLIRLRLTDNCTDTIKDDEIIVAHNLSNLTRS